jgi:hypothetical protein
MDTPELETAPQAHAGQAVASSKALYFQLLDRPQDAAASSRDYLLAQIEAARQEPCELPESVWELPGWIQGRAEAVGIAYREYLGARKNGAPLRSGPAGIRARPRRPPADGRAGRNRVLSRFGRPGRHARQARYGLRAHRRQTE